MSCTGARRADTGGDDIGEPLGERVRNRLPHRRLPRADVVLASGAEFPLNQSRRQVFRWMATVRFLFREQDLSKLEFSMAERIETIGCMFCQHVIDVPEGTAIDRIQCPNCKLLTPIRAAEEHSTLPFSPAVESAGLITEQVDPSLLSYAGMLTEMGEPSWVIVDKLIKRGITRELATAIARDLAPLRAAGAEKRNRDAKRGLVLISFGIVVTLVGIAVLVGNVTGLFPSVPYAGFIMMTAGGLMITAGSQSR